MQESEITEIEAKGWVSHSDWKNLLLQAFESNNMETINYLNKKGIINEITIDVKKGTSSQLLYYATIHSNKEAMNILRAHGAKGPGMFSGKEEILCLLSKEHDEMIESIYENGEVKEEEWKEIVYQAFIKNDKEAIKYLNEKDVLDKRNIDIIDKKGFSLLYYTIMNGN